MRIEPTKSTINHKAIPIAEIRAKGVSSCYKLYEIDSRDSAFLDKLSETIDVKKLMPNLDENEHFIWQGTIEHAIRKAQDEGNKALMETCNGVPCGIMTYEEKGNSIQLHHIATFPIKKGERVPCAGQILMNELFNRLTGGDNASIKLSAARHAPFSPIANYFGMGFRSTGGDDWLEEMRMTREAAQKTIQKQNGFLAFNRIESRKRVNLEECTNLSVFA